MLFGGQRILLEYTFCAPPHSSTSTLFSQPAPSPPPFPYRRSAWARVVDVRTAARTLIGNYRTGYVRDSQFILPPGTTPPTALHPEDSSGKGGTGGAGGAGGAGGVGGASRKGKVGGDGSGGGANVEGKETGHEEGGGEGDGGTAADTLLPRFFTPRECCRLQGFPDSFQPTGCRNELRFYHMIGNAVCVPVVREIARCVLRTGILDSKHPGTSKQ